MCPQNILKRLMQMLIVRILRPSSILLIAIASSSASADYPIGTNLSGISSWSNQRPFTNLFKQSHPWFTQCSERLERDCSNSWDTKEADRLELDEHGWVMSLPERSVPGFSIASTLMQGIPVGNYDVTYEGSGEIAYGLDAKLLKRDRENGIDHIRVSKNPGKLLLQILETDPEQTGDYIKNIQITDSNPQHAETSTTFDQTFLNQLRPYQAIRFMDWMATNGNETVHWEDRLKPETATYSQEDNARGVPIEMMVELANVLDTSPWFTLPHQIDDGYVRNFATLVKDNIQTSKTLYIEYSNETWNQAFPQYRWIANKAKALWPDSSVADTTKVANWHGKRTAEICTIWKDVFAENAEQISCVMGSQAANVWVGEQALACPLWKDNPKATCVDHGIEALAIAPYFGGYLGRKEKEKVLEWTKLRKPLDTLFVELEEIALPEARSWMLENKELAKKYDVELVAYEAGQHLAGTGGFENNEQVTELFIEANRDKRMGTAYIEYYKTWFDNDGGLAMNFSLIGEPSKWGSWGVLEKQDQTSSPKHDAIMMLLSQDQSIE